MSTIFKHIANATNELDGFLELIEAAFAKVVPIVESELHADRIDVFFIAAPDHTIPEYGTGGHTPGPNHCYIYFDPASKNVTKEGLSETLLHEIHHCMRWRKRGYGTTLGEAIVSEGLACLYEEMHRGSPPIYTTQELSDVAVQAATDEIYNLDYDHDKWFYGTDDVPRWFGYSFGYKVCTDYAKQSGRNAAELVGVDPEKILSSFSKHLD